ncbi:ABC transporter ATP-binding protein [Microtetraspora niveoalba]|uniref:ABC transporter ATP-binding protein n=1 Tax=Microtetraspora niveoalba TaxID=46175 RepID=UPI0008374496|nr:oligopeptide/dipeptide ABC transporter ATP-binding protein [Microtetraspora niveoalba]
MNDEPLLRVDRLSVAYRLGTGMLGGRRKVAAVQDVSFEIPKGATFGLVGESGSGKSTTGRAILRLLQPSGGRIVFDGRDVTAFGRRTPLSYRRDVQVVFQDPLSSLNPKQTVRTTIGQTIRRHRKLGGRELRREVDETLDMVGLSSFHGDRLPHELSGGQRQRVAIARAVAVRPKLIVCDEPVSALDVSTQGQVINLLTDLQRTLGVSYLFIAHDLDVVRHVSTTIGVMYLGRLVETGPADEVCTAPVHPYTRMLLDSALVPDPVEQAERRARRRALGRGGEPPSPLAPPPGCAFHTRCRWASEVCGAEVPQMTSTGPARRAACHHAGDPAMTG